MLAVLAGEGRQLVTEGLIRHYDVQTNVYPNTAGLGKIFDTNGANPLVSFGNIALTTATATTAAFLTVPTTRYLTGSNADNDLQQSPISLGVWIQAPPTGTATSYVLMSLGTNAAQRMTVYLTNAFAATGYTLSCASSNNIGTTVTVTMNAGQWYYVHVNLNGSSNQFYLNGVLAGTSTNGFGAATNSNFSLRLDTGAVAGTSAGSISYGAAMVYSRFLLPQEVQQNYNYYRDRFQQYY